MMVAANQEYPHPTSLKHKDALWTLRDRAALVQATPDCLFDFVAQLIGDASAERVVDIKANDAKVG